MEIYAWISFEVTEKKYVCSYVYAYVSIKRQKWFGNILHLRSILSHNSSVIRIYQLI